MPPQTAAMTTEGTAPRAIGSTLVRDRCDVPVQEEGRRMTTSDRGVAGIRDLMSIVPRGGCVLVETDDGGDLRYVTPRDLAIEVAGATGARIVYFDDTATTLAAHAYAWDANPPQAASSAQRPLAATELEELGCGYLREQLEQAETHSIPAFAWLARRPGPSGIAEAAQRCAADLVIVPGESERSCSSRPVLRLTAAYHAWRIGVPVATVDATGRARMVEPLDACQEETRPGPRLGRHAAPLRAA